MSEDAEVYEAPVVEELQEQNDKAVEKTQRLSKKEKRKQRQQETEVSKRKVDEPTYEVTPDVIGVNSFVNHKGSAVTDVMIKRIERHMDYLSGRKGFKNDREREEEQITFMETIGNSLRLKSFDDYVLVTNFLINQMVANEEVFRNGLAFKFTRGLDRKYPAEYVSLYQTYISFLAKIALNWNQRYKLDKLVDMNYAISGLTAKGKEYTSLYFKRLISGK